MLKLNQSGAAPLLILVAVVGIVAFLIFSYSAPFKDGLFSSIYPKSASHAASSNQGDIDLNGKVDIFDYNILLSDFGKTTPGLGADIDNNGKVDIFDFNVLLGNFGKTVTHATPAPSAGSGGNSMAMGKWAPNTKFDTCTTAQHDEYKVKGPDGKWYPTWHPPLGPGGCKFGHEHGRDPSGSLAWKQAKEYFYYDENKNGSMDASEEAVSGLPFGFVNEQLDAYNASKGISGMRHEDHVGHKVDWANDDTDLATDQTSTVKNSGVAIQKNSPKMDTGVRCYFLAKPHQGVSTKDAFTNNIHEVFYFADCKHSNTQYNQKISIAIMEGFGAPGGFTNFMPLCGIERRLNPQDTVCPLGKDATGQCIRDSVNQNYPVGDGGREIISRDCIEAGFLVPSGRFSGNLYEAWPADLNITTAAGKRLTSGINLLFDVEDANRYYHPGKPNNIGMTMDLCYEVEANGDRARGGACDVATNYGRIKDITWDDPRSAFAGTHRGMYFKPAVLDNAGGPQYWYTDPFGGNAQTSPFAGSVKQQIEPKAMNYNSLINNNPIDPRVNDRIHDDGNGTVHAPN